MPKALLILLFTVLLSSPGRADVNIVTTIKPLQLIAEAVVGERGSVSSILEPQQSPHHFTMSPSDRIAFARADLALWVGPELETFLVDFFGQENIRSKTIRALDVPALRLHNIHGGQVDAHLWLDSDNALKIAEEVLRRVEELDSQNAAHFQQNMDRFRADIEATNSSIAERFQSPSNKRYAVYHNAYQYFERQFGLQHEMVVLQDPETQPSIREMMQLRDEVKRVQPSCLLLESDSSEELVRTVLDGHRAALITIDLLGSRVDAANGGYPEFMMNIAEDFQRCLFD